MGVEYEIRKLEIDLDVISNRIVALGAKKKGIFHQKRYVYDFSPVQKGRWIRLRTNGTDSTLTIKEIKSLRIDGTNELEIVVSDFDETNRILNKLGYQPRTFQENFRMEFELNGVDFDFDTWPGIPTYMEIEGNSEIDVVNAVERIGLKLSEFTTLDVDSVYKQVYGIDLDQIKELRFTEAENAKIASLIKEYNN